MSMMLPCTAGRTINESDRWWDLSVAIQNDCVEALQTKMEFHEIDVNTSRWCKECEYDYNGPCSLWTEDVEITPLSLAVHYGAVKCAAYLIKEGARVTIASCNTLQFCTNKYGSLEVE